MKKFFIFFIALVIFAYILGLGIKGQDLLEIERNAIGICLSCMGIQ